MESKNQAAVTFSITTYAFNQFQEQYHRVCATAGTFEKHELTKAYTRMKSFVFEYMPFVPNNQLRIVFSQRWDELRSKLYNDEEFKKLVQIPDRTLQQEIEFNKKYYSYITKMYKLMGLFGDELGTTLMPVRADKKRNIRFVWNTYFYEEFTSYKKDISELLSNFEIYKFKNVYGKMLGFYFAYYLYIDEESRYLCERAFTKILAAVLTEESLSLILEKPENLSKINRELVNYIGYKVHDLLCKIFFRMSYSYSEYGIMPQVVEVEYLDRTTI